MMRGRDHWAVAVRRPDASVHVESHHIRSIGDRIRILRRPLLRGVIALGQALSIGLRALTISANQSVEDENQLSTGQMAISMTLAFVVVARFPAKGMLWGILSRVIAIPQIAGISFELLRLGARFTDAPVMRAIMAPGLWLQKITTRPPDHSQIEVAIASFQEV